MYRAEIAQVPGRDEMYVWYVDAQDAPTNEGIYGTHDGGSTWTAINTAGIDNCGDADGCGTEDGFYALTLAAVPNGSNGTNIYAGSTNAYLCRLDTVTNPTCSAANNGFVNLTHVYGCSPAGSYSHMHPEQHRIAFSNANPGTVFFANDGGIYRSTTNFGTTITGQCGTTPFPVDNLNGRLGSMAQLISFSSDLADPATLFGSVTGSGAAATSSSVSGATGTTWLDLSSGSFGLTVLDANGWFIGRSGTFEIQVCTKGISCTPADWQFLLNAAQVQGDAAGLHFPFLVEPQNPSQIIAGTCRVWRGSSTGGWSASNALSPKLDGSAGTTACATNSRAFVRALAAGGPSNGSGSQVIYAGTEDGRLWVTANASTGTSSWKDVSPVAGGFQDPACGGGVSCPYPVAAVALDPNDATGQTAYAVVLGFGVGHVWQTTSAGLSWTDVSGNLPDVPANSVLVEPDTGLVYVGIDNGVFAAQPKGSSTTWSEVGPATGIGGLPNAPVTQLSLFHPSNQPARLRAATYGRGAWEMPLPNSAFPDFTISVTNSTASAYPNAAVLFHGVLTSINGYSKAVSLACNSGGNALPDHCGNNSSFQPTTGGTSFAVPVSNSSVGDFLFQIQAQDATGLSHSQSVELQVMDFAIASPSPSAVTLAPGANTSVSMLTSSLGTFAQSISISCPEAPTGISCLGNSSALSIGSAQSIPVAISVASGVAVGNYTIALVAASADGLQSKTQSLAVKVQSSTPDFSLQVANQTLSATKVGQLQKVPLTVTSLNGFNGTVALSCNGVPSLSCSVTPPTVSAFPAQATIQIDTAGASATNANLSIVGSVMGGAKHSIALTLPIIAFAIRSVTPPQSTSIGGIAAFSVQLVSENGYAGTIQASCDATSLATSQTCSLTPADAALSANGTSTVQGQISVPQGQAPGLYPIRFSAVDSDYSPLSVTQSMNLSVEGTPTFQIAVSPSSTSLNAGQTTSNVTVTITPQAGFTGTVNLSCASLPSLSSCNFSPATIGTSGTVAQATLQIKTTAVSTAKKHQGPRQLRYWAFALLFPVGLLQITTARGRRKTGGNTVALIVLMILGCAMFACGGSGRTTSGPPAQPLPGTPSGTFTVVVSGTSGNIIQTANFTLTVN